MKLRQGILKVLAYFDLFDYPVSKEEIVFFLDQHIIPTALDETLESLTIGEYVFRHDEFYSLRNSYELVTRRRKGNQNAVRLLARAKKISEFLFQFPFVRGVSISGSLSKNCAPDDADIDYFIITKANRLWIARTLMHVYKKLSFITGRQHWYCMNYYVDEAALEIEEKNTFTAIELITLLPVCGNGIMEAFFKSNDWANNFYPNYRSKTSSYKTAAHDSLFKAAIEFALDHKFGDWIDTFFMKLTTRRWKKKEEQKKVSVKGSRMGLRTGKHFSKPNPVFFQKKILSNYINHLNELTPKWENGLK